MIKVDAPDVKLVMWKKVDLNQRARNEATGKWENTGEKEEKTEYTFRDEFGDVIVLLGSNEYRELEGRQCDVTLGISYSDFDKKNRLSLQACLPAD